MHGSRASHTQTLCIGTGACHFIAKGSVIIANQPIDLFSKIENTPKILLEKKNRQPKMTISRRRWWWWRRRNTIRKFNIKETEDESEDSVPDEDSSDTDFSDETADANEKVKMVVKKTERVNGVPGKTSKELLKGYTPQISWIKP